MSQANVEIARRAYEAATRRPKPDFATVNALYHPDHELVTAMERLEGETRLGAGGFREMLGTFDESFESWQVRIERVSVIDDARVLLTWTGTVQGKQSGAPAEQRGAAIMTVQDEKVTRTETYTSVEEALKAVGLVE
jgi:ketosteroid isomerase-like protein